MRALSALAAMLGMTSLAGGPHIDVFDKPHSPPRARRPGSRMRTRSAWRGSYHTMNADVAWRKEHMKNFIPAPMNTPASVIAHRVRVRAAQLEAERRRAA
jgi:hypothetical protein